MIKCNVTVCGTTSRQAQIRTNKDGKDFVSFGINIIIPAKSGSNKTMEISVAKDCENEDELSGIRPGSRIEVSGIMTFHKKGDNTYMNISAKKVSTSNIAEKDSIKGDMEFRGTVGKQIDTKKDKNGNPFIVFSAYSTEKIGENFAHTWVRFMQFGKDKEEWMNPKSAVNAKGELQIGVFNERLDITCRVSEITPWEKQYSPH